MIFTGFNDKVQTLNVALLDDDSLVQVHTHGIRHIRSGIIQYHSQYYHSYFYHLPDKQIIEWKTPGKKVTSLNNLQYL